ncbi:Rop guanine nucleotide exchange factor 12 [Nymphaea thermarum]|nr:Rop guanine nucleotide exchange factor 12 [Nymphaea thermarum]
MFMKGMFEGRQTHSVVLEPTSSSSPEEKQLCKSISSRTFKERGAENPVGWPLGLSAENGTKSKPNKDADLDQIKERFAKLLLGEDMSGGGKGVSSALALSNAITNLAASVFGEQWRLEPMSAERKARWRKEVDWLLSVTDHVVEFVPSQQKAKDGSSMEIMITRQRKDLHVNIPALRKLDAMLIEYLDNFKDQNEFWYVKRDEDDDKGDGEQRHGDKWWLPRPKVPPEGLSDMSRKWLQYQKESVQQVLKAAMAINAQVLSEMEIPEAYIEALPKNGRASLGDSIYRNITLDCFDPEDFLSTIDLSTEHKILDLKNRIEASVVIWQRKMHNKDVKSTWGSAVSLEKREQFEDRAETILLLIKQRFPGIPQSALDISKIQYNRVSTRSVDLIFFLVHLSLNHFSHSFATKFTYLSTLTVLQKISYFHVPACRDVGQSVIESYSRVLESLAFTVMSRIDDVLYADSLTQSPSKHHRKASSGAEPVKLTTGEEAEKNFMESGPNSMTLSDFMGWNLDQETDVNDKAGQTEGTKWDDGKLFSKPVNLITNMRFIEKLENFGGLRSPSSRH